MSGVDLLALAERVEASAGADNVLNRAVARAVGWGYQTPSEGRRRHPSWFHPDDCRNGEPVLDSLHGTDVWREPLQYLTSLDAAMTLVPEGFSMQVSANPASAYATVVDPACEDELDTDRMFSAGGKTPALALVSAALRARHQSAAGEEV